MRFMERSEIQIPSMLQKCPERVSLEVELRVEIRYAQHTGSPQAYPTITMTCANRPKWNYSSVGYPGSRTLSMRGQKKLYSPLLLGCERGVRRSHALAMSHSRFPLGGDILCFNQSADTRIKFAICSPIGPVVCRSQRMTNIIQTVANGRPVSGAKKQHMSKRSYEPVVPSGVALES